MKVLVSGASGFIGSALVPVLESAGHQIIRLVRSTPASRDAIQWDPFSGRLDVAALAGIDAVIHLAGENIGAGRWTAARKARIKDSRIKGTKLLAETLATMNPPPKVLVMTSAVGFYGDRGDEIVDEKSAPGKGFLTEVCQAWEAAAKSASEKDIRIVQLRLGVVLSPKGGALKKMLLPFRLGVGGVIGGGRQYMSWVALDDVINVFTLALGKENMRGTFNLVAPSPATNRAFTKILGRVISRPTIFPLPAFVVKLIFGEMGESMLLGSTRAIPTKLLEAGYEFRFPELEGAFRHLLGQ